LIAGGEPMVARFLRQEDVDGVLLRYIPEFAGELRDHRQDYESEPQLYILASRLFEFTVSLKHDQKLSRDARADLIKRVYAAVDELLAKGDSPVSDPFAMEMVAPLAQDRDGFYRDLEAHIGETANQALERIRERVKRSGF
jgi:hypothetical protein